MKRPKIEDFKVKDYNNISDIIKQYSKAQDLYIKYLENLILKA